MSKKKKDNIFLNISLNDPEQSPSFHAIEQYGGVNSDIVYHHYPNGEKKVVARYGTRKGGFSPEEAIEMAESIMEYQQLLEKRGVPLPPIEKVIHEYSHRDKRAIVVKTSQWTGHEIKKIIKQSHATEEKQLIFDLVQEIFSVLIPVCADRHEGWEITVGIDPRCTNFTLDTEGKVWFVDLFPPRYRKDGVPMVEWPEPKNELGRRLGHFKHYDIRGIALCAFEQLCRIKPALREEFERLTMLFCQQSMSPQEYVLFVQELEKTPWIRLRALLKDSGADAKDAIRDIILSAPHEIVFGVQYYVYSLREIALELAAAGRMTHDELEEFFKASHFEDYLPDEVLKGLQSRLIHAAEAQGRV